MESTHSRMVPIRKLILHRRGQEALSLWKLVTVKPHDNTFDYVDYFGAGVIIGIMNQDTEFTLEMLTRFDSCEADYWVRERLDHDVQSHVQDWIFGSNRPLEAVSILEVFARRAPTRVETRQFIELIACAYEEEADSRYSWSLGLLRRHSRRRQEELRQEAARLNAITADEYKASAS